MAKTFPALAREHDSVMAKNAAALERLAHVVLALQWQAAGQIGLTGLQGLLLAQLAVDASLGVKELAERLRLSRPTVSRALGSLRRKKLIAAHRSAVNKRRVSFRLTPAGQSKSESLQQVAEPLLAALATLGAEGQEVLWQQLLRLLTALGRQGVMGSAGLCPTCRFFTADPAGRSFYCKLLQQPLSVSQLRLDCPEHEAAEQPSKR
ncbi:MAG: MarR family transcriptional regulator [Thermoanaerobaculum sp.]|nr:MarR family transcriptional regulator [Thermoanaerobaculum sp.]MDW7968035.1 MarR family transcriptional regulator [Thermoanaerobaculum sp.]